MDKKLPSIFANKVSKDATHNVSVAYSGNNTKEKRNSPMNLNDNLKMVGQNINQKINSIFSSTKYVYKADVNITLKDKIIKRRVIGRNSVHLITIDNELIPIGDIIDIEFSN